jgi:hypothetical protein
MTLKIEVLVPEDEVRNGAAAQYLDAAVAALGFRRSSAASKTTLPEPRLEMLPDEPSDGSGHTVPAPEAEVAPETPAPSPRRYGEPEEGRKRRTKEAMAVDKEIEALADRYPGVNLLAAPAVEMLEALASGSIPPEWAVDGAPETPPNISAVPENRVDPADAAQDAADEAAEVEANRGPVTHDDLRQAVGEFSKKHGIAAASKAVPNLIGYAVADVPEDELETAIAIVREATEKFVADAPAPEAAPTPPRTATKEEAVEAALRYADKYDGNRDFTDLAKVPALTEDLPRVLSAALGEGVTGISKIPDTPEAYGKAAAAFEAATAENPFNREAK